MARQPGVCSNSSATARLQCCDEAVGSNCSGFRRCGIFRPCLACAVNHDQCSSVQITALHLAQRLTAGCVRYQLQPLCGIMLEAEHACMVYAYVIRASSAFDAVVCRPEWSNMKPCRQLDAHCSAFMERCTSMHNRSCSRADVRARTPKCLIQIRGKLCMHAAVPLHLKSCALRNARYHDSVCCRKFHNAGNSSAAGRSAQIVAVALPCLQCHHMVPKFVCNVC